jgi:hypothetical protein
MIGATSHRRIKSSAKRFATSVLSLLGPGLICRSFLLAQK